MKLYHIQATRSTRPLWLLEEMNLPYELVYVTREMLLDPEYKTIHPHGKVPLLVDDEIMIYESAAICAYLADKYPEKNMAPAPQSHGRAYYYQWLFYASLTLEAPVEQFMFHVIPNLPEKVLPKSDQTRVPKAEALEWFKQVSRPLNELLSNQEFLVENQFSAADVVTGGVLFWALKLGMMEEESPTKNYINKLVERPAFQMAESKRYYKNNS